MKKILIFILAFSFCFTLYAEEKPIISVLDFNTEEGISKSEMRLFISLLSSALFQTKLYTVIDVSERDTLLSELEFAVSDCTDESCQLEIGRLLAAEAIIIGTIGRLGSRYVLSIKMLETDTGRAINTADGVYESIDAMVDDVGIIANKLASAHKEEVVVEEEDVIEEENIVEEENIEETTIEEEVVIDDTRPKPTPKPKKEKKVQLSVGMEVGPIIPMGQLGEYYRIGTVPLALVDLKLNLGKGKLGLGIISGVNLEGTNDNEEIRFQFEMPIIPVGGNISFESGFMLPFFLLFDVSGGITFGFVSYWESYQDVEDETFIKPFTSITAGFGFAITPGIRLSLCTSYMAIFFDSNPLHGFCPMTRVEIHF